jgi:methylated-DNA-[protein]-cysteine S-methyltransferase
MQYDWVNTRWGRLLIVADDEALRAVRFEGSRHFERPERHWRRNGPVAAEAARQLRAYLRGDLPRFELPLAPQGTAFERRVWRVVQKIPYGRTLAYGEVAARLRNPHAARAVGGAVGHNPIVIVIPCHRVVGRGGRLGGFSASLERKRALLQLEQRS